MSKSQVIEILGEPYRKMTFSEVLKDSKFVGGLSADSPRWQDEFWLYKLEEFEYEITIKDGKVSNAKKIKKK
ncbi:hypothetical protein [Aliterella atlantica]|nr:hypothetical protein [Aliterella atlantica]